MYLPKLFAQKDIGLLQAHIQQYPFGTLATAIGGIPQMNHLPFYFDIASNCLQAHIPKVNPLYAQVQAWLKDPVNSQDLPVLIAFQGPDAYITPSWYPSKLEHGKVVPTWNYAVVHAKGRLKLQEDKDWLTHHLTNLTNQQEPRRNSTWEMTDAPVDYTDGMMRVLCGLEITVDELLGKYKVSQNREKQDQAGVLQHLEQSEDWQDRQLANLTTQTINHSNKPKTDY
jgi:transcriptional regulator